MSNEQALAYAVVAMKKSGVRQEVIDSVKDTMYRLFDVLTEYEAVDKARQLGEMEAALYP